MNLHNNNNNIDINVEIPDFSNMLSDGELCITSHINNCRVISDNLSNTIFILLNSMLAEMAFNGVCFTEHFICIDGFVFLYMYHIYIIQILYTMY